MWEHRAGDLRVPASTLKILTALAALDTLGGGYRFPTDVYTDGDGGIVVKGHGDPLLVSEAIQGLAGEVAGHLTRCTRIVMDDSAFAPGIVIPGAGTSLNPYDATVGALVANFNTVFFSRNKQGRLLSAEEETPLVPFVREIIRRRNLPEGRVVLSRSDRETTLYPGHLLAHFLAAIDPDLSCREVVVGAVGPQASPVLRFESPYTLAEVLEKILEYSNNLMANQVLLAMGARVYGPPANLDKGLAVLRKKIDSLGLNSTTVVEGSGISRQNRMTARDMGRLLRVFEPHAHLLREHDRLPGVRYKSGHLDGVRTLAGYIPARNGGRHAFVIFMNTKGASAQTVLHRLVAELP